MKIVPATFGQWSEEDLKGLHPKEFRVHEAFYFYDMFRVACGQPPLRLANPAQESQFLWITFADSFLTMLVSVEEFVNQATQKALHNADLYRFIKQLRNITVHRTVLAARKHKHGATPLVNRIYYAHIGGDQTDYVDPKINFKRIRRELRRVMTNQPKQFHGHVPGARRFLRVWKKDHDSVVLRELFEEGLAFVGRECKLKMVEP